MTTTGDKGREKRHNKHLQAWGTHLPLANVLDERILKDINRAFTDKERLSAKEAVGLVKEKTGARKVNLTPGSHKHFLVTFPGNRIYKAFFDYKLPKEPKAGTEDEGLGIAAAATA